ncbi:MAG: quinone-dependent dihydroorotate dehydrogenase [Rhodospirillales bacterium]|nr:quinone-dependent dihydroorotate dehydrogenase [Rhodospirillales bacterium]
MVNFYDLTGPFIRLLDPELAHGFAIKGLKMGIVPRPTIFNDSVLESNHWGLKFRTPIGMAAGFDKNADVPDEVLAQGFGSVEIGSITPRPQPGNPKPRMFRLTRDRAVINRMGFNSQGMQTVAARLKERARSSHYPGVVGINLGKNKETEDAAADYVLGINAFADYADYLVVNVSSPNTPGLRALQDRDQLAELLSRCMEALKAIKPEGTPPLLLKIAPDLTDEDKQDIAGVVLELKIDGLITTNTTIERPDSLMDPQKSEIGGLSGVPLLRPSTEVLRQMYSLTEGKVPIVGVGGIVSGEDAYEKIRAGASLVQFYSAMIYKGPSLANTIAKDLAQLLKRDGYTNVSDAVGADHRARSS